LSNEAQTGLPARIAIAGQTSAGKTTLARTLSAATGAPCIELDAYFHQPGWTPAETEDFRARVGAAVAAPRWISDGNYAAVRDLTWGNADLVIWLDYSLPLILWRLTQRTARRVISREELWNGNREELRFIFSKESLHVWAVTSHRRHRRTYPQEFARLHVPRVVRVRSPRALDAWLRRNGIASAASEISAGTQAM
jgi:adenylate kinase family enzyme